LIINPILYKVMKLIPRTAAPIKNVNHVGGAGVMMWTPTAARASGEAQGSVRGLAGPVEGQEVLSAGEDVVKDGGGLLLIPGVYK
jgi:hypothetical protein